MGNTLELVSVCVMLCPMVSPPSSNAPVVPGFSTRQPKAVPATSPFRRISVASPVGNTGLLLVGITLGLGYTMTVVNTSVPLAQPFSLGVTV